MKKIIIFLSVLICLALIISNVLLLIKKNQELNENFLLLAEELANDGCDKSQLKISPNNAQLGYFIDLNCLNKNSSSIDYENHTSLRIIDLDKISSKEIYKGNYHTSSWEWLNDNEVIVYCSCGTECMAVYLIDADTGEQKTQLVYGVGYEWAPNKKIVLAYNYSAGYGITVGDKNNNELLVLRREFSDLHNNLVYETRALWSPDSSKLALVIKKENVDGMEILVFETKDFEQIFRSDIEFAENAEFAWADNNKIIYDGVEFLIN